MECPAGFVQSAHDGPHVGTHRRSVGPPAEWKGGGIPEQLAIVTWQHVRARFLAQRVVLIQAAQVVEDNDRRCVRQPLLNRDVDCAGDLRLIECGQRLNDAGDRVCRIRVVTREGHRPDAGQMLHFTIR